LAVNGSVDLRRFARIRHGSRGIARGWKQIQKKLVQLTVSVNAGRHSEEITVLKAVFFAFSASLAALTLPAAAQQPPPIEPQQVVDGAVLDQMRAWIANPILAVTLRAQNKRHVNLAETQIKELDDRWRKETAAQDQPLISATLTSPLSIFLLRVQAASQGLYAEVFVMDNKGLNAGQSTITSDYWQGDEDKFQKTFNVAPDAVFIDKPEFHEATKTWRSQVSLTLVDPDTKEKIGAITVEVNLTEMLRRKTA
jgi:hypothetical protein